MVQQIFAKTIATYPISANIPKKTIKKSGKSYILVNNDPIKKSKCLSLIKAVGLSLVTAYTFCLSLANRKFRTVLFDNWRAVFTGDRKVERYEIAKSSSTATPSAQTNQHSNYTDQKPVSAKKQPSPKKTAKPKKAKSKKPVKGIQKDTLIAIINTGLPKADGRLDIKMLEEYRHQVFNLLNNKGFQSAYYNNDNDTIAHIDVNGMKKSGIPLNRYGIEAVLRYLLLKGDIFAYTYSGTCANVALNEHGLDYFPPSSTLPLTKELLKNTYQEMQKFVKPEIPEGYNHEQKKLWEETLINIEDELFKRNLSAAPEKSAFQCSFKCNSTLKDHLQVFDDLARLGTITEWNSPIGSDRRAIIKFETSDTHDSDIQYHWDNWRNKDNISAER